MDDLQAEKLADVDAKASRLFLGTVSGIYRSVSEGMVSKNKEEEHRAAIRRTNDIIKAGIEAWQQMTPGAETRPAHNATTIDAELE